MKLNRSKFANSVAVKNIIFDFGGVICNIDISKTEQAFTSLGMRQPGNGRTISDTGIIFEQLEIGAITPDGFHKELRKFFIHPVTDEQLDWAWNKLLLDIPEPRIRLLEKIKKQYRIFLLSNSNEIHYKKFRTDFEHQYGYGDFNCLFEKAYFSFQIGLKKPDREIFDYVLKKSGLCPGETLFIDDTLQHVQGAEKTGIYAYHLRPDIGEQIMDLFQNE